MESTELQRILDSFHLRTIIEFESGEIPAHKLLSTPYYKVRNNQGKFLFCEHRTMWYAEIVDQRIRHFFEVTEKLYTDQHIPDVHKYDKYWLIYNLTDLSSF